VAAVPLDRLLAAQADLKTDLMTNPDPVLWSLEAVTAMLPWQPVVDGDVLPAPPIDGVTAGMAADVDLMVGSNTDEHRLFLVTTGMLTQMTDAALTAAVTACGLAVEPALAAYRTAHRGASAGDLFAALQTDWYWRIPAVRLADAHAQGAAPTYMYEFAWRSPQFGGQLGASHSLEIAFVFDTLGRATEPLLGPNPPQALASAMHAAWVAFATSGDPGWPHYGLARRKTMHFDTTCEVVDDPLAAERALWQGVR
jgi:carboxylesterase 2/para-nitrobenzyl esterase